jgi:Asp-tRNA(Asn)/Glu-tRNA(Gln) amidotransferase C subunit
LLRPEQHLPGSGVNPKTKHITFLNRGRMDVAEYSRRRQEILKATTLLSFAIDASIR